MKWKELHKIAVSGSRRFPNSDLVAQYLEQYIKKNYKNTEDVVVITGGAIGVDAIVELACMRKGIKNLIIHARWLELELPAGPRRNQHIIDMADELLAFWDGSSRGTSDAISKARLKGMPVKIFSPMELKKELKYKEPVKIVIPGRASETDAHKMRQLVEDAALEEIVPRKKRKKKKKLYDNISKFFARGD